MFVANCNDLEGRRKYLSMIPMTQKVVANDVANYNESEIPRKICRKWQKFRMLSPIKLQFVTAY